MLLRGQDGSEQVFEMRQEYTQVSDMGGSEADPDWVFTDGAGHEHRRVGRAVPTLVTVQDTPGGWCHDCQDEHEGDSHQECAQCREEVRPGTRFRAPGMVMIPGMSEYRIDGEYVTPDEFKARYAAALETAVLK